MSGRHRVSSGGISKGSSSERNSRERQRDEGLGSKSMQQPRPNPFVRFKNYKSTFFSTTYTLSLAISFATVKKLYVYIYLFILRRGADTFSPSLDM